MADLRVSRLEKTNLRLVHSERLRQHHAHDGTRATTLGRDRVRHVIDIRLSATVAADAVPHTPALRPIPAGRIAVDLPHSRPAPVTRASGHTVAVGFDRGVGTLLTASPDHHSKPTASGRGYILDREEALCRSGPAVGR